MKHSIFTKYIIIALLFLVSKKTEAQYSFFKTDTLPVFANNKELKMAFAGGLNYMQFSAIDLNYDGVKDLFAFDRSSNKVNTFLNGGKTDSIDYNYAPNFTKMFPQELRSWVLLVDYNCDGKEDIFTQYQGAIRVFKNDGDAKSGLHFSLTKSKIYSLYSTDSLPLYVSSVDIPTITDIDNDGDIDIVTYAINGDYLEFHKNVSKENFNTCDSLHFLRATSCWSDIKEDQSNCNMYLNNPCGNFVFNYTKTIEERAAQHTGSALLALDLDGDNDKDILISDISCNTIKAITNGGTVSKALGTQQDVSFPNYDTPINISNFPQAYFLDVNNDGKKDLLASSNTSTSSENKNSVWYYRNLGTTNKPNFKFQNTNFLVGEMIDNGEGAYPAFFDYNNDTLLDFVIGNIGRYENSLTKARLMLYVNIGTKKTPKYKLENDDYLGLSGATNLNYIVPTFGDLDNDGDYDLLLGCGDGELLYYLNTAPKGANASFILAQPNYASIDVGYCAAPQLVDINRDAKLDLVIGNSIGKISYYQNTGTTQVPLFTHISSNFGNVYTGIDNGVNIIDGYCTPHFFDINGSYKLHCGSKSGRVFQYSNIDGNLTGAFNKLDTNYLNIWEGYNSSLAIADINNDGLLDMLLGNICGGLNYYSGIKTSSISELKSTPIDVRLFPNPAKGLITLSATKNIDKLELFTTSGQLIYTATNINTNNTSINLQNMVNGVYYCKLYIENDIVLKKLVLL